MKAEGIHLAFSLDGDLEVTGNKEAVEKYLPILRKRKAELIAELKDLHRLPAWCIGTNCMDFEVITLQRQGPTPGCIIEVGMDMENWRRLDRMDRCPLDK